MLDSRYWLWLSLIFETGSSLCDSILYAFNHNAKAIYEADRASLSPLCKNNDLILSRLLDKRLDKVYGILDFCEKENVGILTPENKHFPSQLLKIAHQPLVLYYKGRLPDFERSLSVSVVGTRSVTAYGSSAAYTISHDLASTGATVVSGMALGADTAAHRGALDAGGHTVALLGCGIDIIYPKENARLMQEIISRGTVMTEYAPGLPPKGTHFPIRNRLISGISSAVLVIEASEKSGALITASHGLKQGKLIYAVPGKVGELASTGTNLLIRNGAKMVTSAKDIISDFSSLYEFRYAGKPRVSSVKPDAATENGYSYGEQPKTERVENNFISNTDSRHFESSSVSNTSSGSRFENIPSSNASSGSRFENIPSSNASSSRRFENIPSSNASSGRRFEKSEKSFDYFYAGSAKNDSNASPAPTQDKNKDAYYKEAVPFANTQGRTEHTEFFPSARQGRTEHTEFFPSARQGIADDNRYTAPAEWQESIDYSKTAPRQKPEKLIAAEPRPTILYNGMTEEEVAESYMSMETENGVRSPFFPESIERVYLTYPKQPMPENGYEIVLSEEGLRNFDRINESRFTTGFSETDRVYPVASYKSQRDPIAEAAAKKKPKKKRLTFKKVGADGEGEEKKTGDSAKAKKSPSPKREVSYEGLNETESAVLRFIFEHESTGIDAMAELNIPVSKLLSTVTVLEIKGRIVQKPGGYLEIKK